ncbi:Ail/Lom family outer membrane beta-barrel protein [Vibrio injensis]|uniref:Ail/Lom family outer membrane beta-barrel protein n=1 Tax=Vibrio injensis TaxID=1307414 RepID=UPI0009328D40|nr:Ail/Lom family outer membrane beta-barrel protein [Vibrio injensis]
MKKTVTLVILSALFSNYGFAYDNENRLKSAITTGFSHSTVKTSAQDLNDNPMGFNIKYRKDITSNYGLIASFTYTGMDKSYPAANSSLILDLDYYSYMIGPTFRANEKFSVYGLVGMASGKAKALSAQNNKYTVILSESETDIAYGAGLQFDVSERFTIDTSYEYAKFNEVKAGTWTVGVGYRF